MTITYVFSCCFQMQTRGWLKGSPWTVSSITLRCCSARRTTCCMWALERCCLPSASRTSARPNCRRTCVWYPGKFRIDQPSFSNYFKITLGTCASDAAAEKLFTFDWIWRCLKCFFRFPLQLTWGTPAGKREECSFKGKNLEVRERDATSAK